jgi:NAD(P)-dependent dehydrogenase (short-subunit alcohol dehydrogenase family)
MAKRFDEHVVWITGGGTGIGKAIAIEFANQGAKVAVSGRRLDRLEGAVAELKALGADALAVPCDVTDEESVQAAVEAVVQHFGKLDVCVANAGFSVAGRIKKLRASEWRRQFDVNVIGVAITCRAALPHLEATKGRVALIGSVAALFPAPGLGPYAASKAAVRCIGMALSGELHGTGVSCTTIHPGFVESEIAQVDNQGRFDGDREDRRPKNLMWKSDRAARVIVNGIYKRKREFVFTGHGKVGAFFGQHFPGLGYMATRGK